METISAIVGLAVFVLYIYMAWKVVAKAGYHGAWSLTLLIPLVNIAMIYIFAFSKWPVLRNRAAPAQSVA